MRAVYQQILLAALRERLFAILFLAVAAIVLVSSFLSDQSLIERNESAMVFAAFASRLLLVSGMALFCIVSARRLFESGEILVLLSRPQSRGGFLLACFAGFWTAACLLLAADAGLLLLFTHPAPVPLLRWTAGLAAESGVVIAFALFAVMGLENTVGAFTLTLAFYLLTRLCGVMTSLANSEFRQRSTSFDLMMDQASRVAGILLPRLDRLSSDWLGHETASMPALLFIQIAIYTALLLGAALFDLERKRL